MRANDFLAKGRGTFIINKGVTKTGKFIAVEVLSNAVITALVDSDGRTSVIDSYMTDKATAVPAGAIIKALPGKSFSSITVQSGVVQLILE